MGRAVSPMITLAGLLILSAPLAAQDHAQHQHHGTDGHWLPSEGGQATLAALAEIVARLEADPDTDWSTVDLAALREHLVDMHQLALYAEAEETPVAGGLRIRVFGPPRALAAVKRMVPAHAGFLDRRPGWRADTETHEDHVMLTVVAEDPAGERKIRALGLFGLMATEDHHQAHHWALARGKPMH